MTTAPNTEAMAVDRLADMPVDQALPRDLMLMKMENDQMMAQARVRPRDLVATVTELKAQLKAFPLLAAKCIYAKPVGKDKDGKQKYARGLSIRAAELIAEAYGFNRVALSSEPLTPGSDERKLTATFVDYQRCRMWTTSVDISPWYKDAGGRMVKMPLDRYLDLKVKAELSKLGREAILRCTSTAMKIELEDFAERCLLETLPEDFAQRSVAVWSGKGVTLEQLEALIGKPAPLWAKSDGVTLTQLWQALLDEETTVAQIFGTDVGTPATGATGPVTAAAFSAPQQTTPRAPDPVVDAGAALGAPAEKIAAPATPAAAPPAKPTTASTRRRQF